MDHFAAIVRIGEHKRHRTDEHVEEVLRLHVETGCWTSPPGRTLRPGTPVIASHTGAGIGRFLVGAFTGKLLKEIPWQTSSEHAQHVPHGVVWMDAVFIGDPDSIPGAKQRAFRWLSSAEFSAALGELTVRTKHPSPARR
jgi:hypothetical protein